MATGYILLTSGERSRESSSCSFGAPKRREERDCGMSPDSVPLLVLRELKVLPRLQRLVHGLEFQFRNAHKMG